MFGLFKSAEAPEGPVEFENEIEIGASAEEVYRLLDFGDRANAHRARGDTVIDLGGGCRFEMCIDGLHNLNFCFAIIEAEPHTRYGFDCTMQPPVGNLVSSRESYEIEALGPDNCRLKQTTSAQFVEGLRLKAYVRECSVMAEAVALSQFKLKLQAEEGVAAVKEFEEAQQV